MLSQDHVEFLEKWLKICETYDKQDDFHWMFDKKQNKFRITVNCNDLFEWATADCEELTPENLDSYIQTIEDAQKVYKYGHIWADSIWACRQRKMRPQGACYKHYPIELWPLFDECGPERETNFFNPGARPKSEEEARSSTEEHTKYVSALWENKELKEQVRFLIQRLHKAGEDKDFDPVPYLDGFGLIGGKTEGFL